MRTKVLTLPAVVLFLFSGCLPAHNSKKIDSQLTSLQRQDYQLKTDLQALQENQEKSQQALQSRYAALKADFQSLKEELQSLRGDLQTTTYRLEQHLDTFAAGQQAEQEREKRLRRMEDYLGVGAAATESNAEKTEESALTEEAVTREATSPAEKLYATALQTFEEGKYPAAREAFTEVLEKFSESEICDNARFWIGESYYREKWYEKAILEYQKVIDNYPDGNKVPAALLKQGMAFHNINDNTNARLVFKKLIRQYPDANETRIAEKKRNEL